MNWLYYLAEANLYLGVFYLAYCLFLTKETYYQLTRAYLLFACVVSFILPGAAFNRQRLFSLCLLYRRRHCVFNVDGKAVCFI